MPARTRRGHAVRRRRPRSRRRPLTIVLVLLAAALLAGGASWWAVRSPFFAVTTVRTGAYRFTSADRLDARLGIFLGRNLWTVGSAEVADSLRCLPWIKDLRIGRRLPGTVEVEFTEWRPLAAVAPQDLPETGEGGTWVLTDEGTVLEIPAGLVPPALPTLAGCGPRPEGRPGILALPAADASSLLELFSAIADAGLEAIAPVDFVVVREEGFAIVLEERQGRLLVGREEFAPRLRRFMAARDHLDPDRDVDLRFADRVTVRPPTGTGAGKR